MILIINICDEKLHYYEFVKPIENLVEEEFVTKHYLDLTDEDLKKARKVIICGTSLKDNKFIENLEKFSWIKSFDKPILSICGGMQLIGLVFGGELKQKTEIGFYLETFEKEFLGLKGEQEVYHLHNNHVLFDDKWEIFSENGGITQAVKHKEKELYGVLFHPEVRQKEMVLRFVNE